MGVRSYIPSLGRFLTPDPVPGGSANPYDYADQDPVNNFDLGGEKLCINVGRANEVCGHKAKELKQAAHRANKTGKIHVTFASKQDAERFRHYLQLHSASNWVKLLNLKANDIKAAQLYKIEKKAQEIAVHEASVSSGDDCKAISATVGTILNIVGYGAAPETGGASLGLNGVGVGVSWAGAYAC